MLAAQVWRPTLSLIPSKAGWAWLHLCVSEAEMEVPQSKMASWTHWIRVLWVQVRTPTSVSKVEYNLGRHWCPHMWPYMHTYHIHKHRKQKPHLCYCQRAERGQEAASLQCWELNPAPYIPTTEFPALILACLLAASLSSGLQCWEVVLPQWLLLGYFQISVSIHIPALVFPGWQGDELLGTVTFIFCTHCAVGRREWSGQWRTCLCLFSLLLSDWPAGHL